MRKNIYSSRKKKKNALNNKNMMYYSRNLPKECEHKVMIPSFFCEDHPKKYGILTFYAPFWVFS